MPRKLTPAPASGQPPYSRRLIDMTGRRYGYLEVLHRDMDAMGYRKEPRWIVRCHGCDGTKSIVSSRLRKGETRSCGCRTGELISAANTTHGATIGGDVTPEFSSWKSMKRRCFNVNDPNYSLYGGRGITVCEEWREDFPAFLTHIGRRPSLRHSLDRIDNSKGYEPGNVRWATQTQQIRNRRCNRLVTARGETMTVMAWSEVSGVNNRTIIDRLSRGWEAERAVFAPAETCCHPKLSAADAPEMVSLAASGMTYNAIGRRFGVSGVAARKAILRMAIVTPEVAAMDTGCDQPERGS